MVYKPKFAAEAREMCRLGATDEELAEHFKVCVRTIYRWRNTHEEFAEAVVVGKEHADARVERALYSRAVGCSVERTKVFRHAGEEKPVCATYTHHYPPDPNAALQWLRTRQPKKWRAHEEEEVDESFVERFQKGLARVAAYKEAEAKLAMAAAAEARARNPGTEPGEETVPVSQPVPPPRPGPEPERDPEQPPAPDAACEPPSAEWERPSPIWDPKPMMGPSRWHYENGKNRPP